MSTGVTLVQFNYISIFGLDLALFSVRLAILALRRSLTPAFDGDRGLISD